MNRVLFKMFLYILLFLVVLMILHTCVSTHSRVHALCVCIYMRCYIMGKTSCSGIDPSGFSERTRVAKSVLRPVFVTTAIAIPCTTSPPQKSLASP
mmetsp:Transcript_36120/g.55470  ORF Transcript_36120/g.55470 Transcript_36120/m.55470 type:complete len:96 (-) Transcript_36120:1247-1534(-)